MRLLRMHPEVLFADTTHGTNREKKELFTIAAKDGTNSAFNVCRAFIPNAQTWVFQLLFQECLPHFFGRTVLNGVRLVITDGAVTEYVPFITNTGCNNPFPHALHGLCYFHIAIQGYQKHVLPSITDTIKNSYEMMQYIKIFRFWIKTWFYTIESVIEYNYSRNMLFNWLDSTFSSHSENLVSVIKNWIITKLDPYEPMWINYKNYTYKVLIIEQRALQNLCIHP